MIKSTKSTNVILLLLPGFNVIFYFKIHLSHIIFKLYITLKLNLTNILTYVQCT